MKLNKSFVSISILIIICFCSLVFPEKKTEEINSKKLTDIVKLVKEKAYFEDTSQSIKAEKLGKEIDVELNKLFKSGKSSSKSITITSENPLVLISNRDNIMKFVLKGVSKRDITFTVLYDSSSDGKDDTPANLVEVIQEKSYGEMFIGTIQVSFWYLNERDKKNNFDNYLNDGMIELRIIFNELKPIGRIEPIVLNADKFIKMMNLYDDVIVNRNNEKGVKANTAKKEADLIFIELSDILLLSLPDGYSFTIDKTFADTPPYFFTTQFSGIENTNIGLHWGLPIEDKDKYLKGEKIEQPFRLDSIVDMSDNEFGGSNIIWVCFELE